MRSCSKTKASQAKLVRVVLFWESHRATFAPAWLILYHVAGEFERIGERTAQVTVH